MSHNETPCCHHHSGFLPGWAHFCHLSWSQLWTWPILHSRWRHHKLYVYFAPLSHLYQLKAHVLGDVYDNACTGKVTTTPMSDGITYSCWSAVSPITAPYHQLSA